jgi:hypothetical protein
MKILDSSNDMKSSYSLVLTIVIVPFPLVFILIRLTTVLPDNPGPLIETRGMHANSPTGWRTGFAGLNRSFLLISSSVIHPSVPPGFTTTNGDIIPTLSFFFLLVQPSFSIPTKRNGI